MNLLPHVVATSRNARSFPLLLPTLFLLTVPAGTWTVERHALLTSTICWLVVWGVCCRLSKKPARFAGGGRRQVVLTGSCMLLSAVCERAAEIRTGWIRTLPPLIYFLLRELGVGVLVHLDSPAAGKGLLICLVTATSYLAIGNETVYGHSTDIVLGGCSAVFAAVGYVFLEDSIPPADTPGSLGAAGASEEFWSSCVQLGRELGMFLAIGFMAATLAVEDTFRNCLLFQGRGFARANLFQGGTDWQVVLQVSGVGFLAAARWMIIPRVVSRYSVVSVTFMELVTALLLNLGTAFTLGKFALFVATLVAMVWYFMVGLPGKAGMEQCGGLGMMRRTHITVLVLLSMIMVMTYCLSSVVPPIKAPMMPFRGSNVMISGSKHPILQLVEDANARHSARVSSQSKTLEEAVREYQRRYNMNPPPNFDRWYEYAKQRNVVLIDDYDSIYHSLKPFWGLPPKEIRKRVREAMGFRDEHIMKDNRILHAYVRQGQVRTGGQGPDWQKEATEGMIRRFSEFLPDMDLPFNIHDEPRVIVPNDLLGQYVRRADDTIRAGGEAKNKFTPLPPEEEQPLVDYPLTQFNVFAHQRIWSHATASCPADSPVRNIDPNTPDAAELYSVQPLGFLSNTSAASDICLSPSLEWRHGFFDRPNALNIVQDLHPVFSQSKVSSFNDILYPSPWYWFGKVTYDEGADMSWDQKSDALYWRGSTTGGFSRNGGWRFQHRQRVVQVINDNATSATILQVSQRDGNGAWETRDVPRESLAESFDVHFSHVGQCDPADCDAQKRAFYIAPMAQQQDAWKWKFLLDIDGNAFSGRYYAFLKSHSAVFKIAYFREWHDEWLEPWVHYVPLGLELGEVAETMRFFRFEREGMEAIQAIAEQGREWANKVLRNEDLEAWFFRLLLEYGRVVDDNRDTIGFVR